MLLKRIPCFEIQKYSQSKNLGSYNCTGAILNLGTHSMCQARRRGRTYDADKGKSTEQIYERDRNPIIFTNKSKTKYEVERTRQPGFLCIIIFIRESF